MKSKLKSKKAKKYLLLLAMCLCVFVVSHSAQTTEFTYQGRLLDSNLPPTANYDFQFTLWDSLANGTQQGATQTVVGVAVANGIFTVRLDFGAQFTGAARFLQIAVRTAGGGAYTTLAPRQSFTSAPYAVRSLNSTTADTATNALNLGGVAASQYVVTTDPRMTDARNPLAGSANYIWNQNSVLQPSSNFIISGNGFIGGILEANVVDATTQYNIGGNRVLSNPGEDNLFAGIGAGASNTTGLSNTFMGESAGMANTTGGANSFLGRGAGRSNTGGSFNAFFGEGSGRSNTDGGFNAFFGHRAGFSNIGSDNAFFGSNAGFSNTTGGDNAFFGRSAGLSNDTGVFNAFFGSRVGTQNTFGFENSFFGSEAGFASQGIQNAFFGRRAGEANTTGDRNSFFGTFAGNTNTTGSHNTIIGYNADVLGNGLRNATAIGQRAAVGADNSLILGAISGVNGCGEFGSFCESVNVGIGTTTPATRLHVVGGNDAATTGGGYIVTGDVGAVNLVIDNNEIIARNNGNVSTLFLNADGGDVNLIQNSNGNVGIGIATTPQDKLHVDGIIRVASLGAGGATNVCRNASDQLSTCSSSLRYKTNINRFGLGLNLINQLKPITFDWKDGGMNDLGLGAEDVAAIEPLLVTYNKKGEVEGVKYDRIGVVAVNAIKEQQAEISGQKSAISEQQRQIEALNLKIKDQQLQLDALKKLVCSQNPTAEICKEEK